MAIYWTLSLHDPPTTLLIQWMLHVFLTDHAALHCALNLTKPQPTKKHISYRKYGSLDHDSFSNDISQSELITNPSNDLQTLIDQYNSTLKSILEKHAPLKTRCITIRPANPWYSPEIADAKRLRKKLERRWRKTRSESDRNQFKAQRLCVVNMINSAKSSYFKEKLASCGNQRELYKIVESLLHNKGKTKLPTHDNKQELATTFSDYFITKIQNIRNDLTLDLDCMQPYAVYH